MALHGKQSKTKRQIKTHHTKPSRQARFNKRAAARKRILDDGTGALEVLPKFNMALDEAVQEIADGHKAGTWSPEQQRAAEQRRAKRQSECDALTTKIWAAEALQSKLNNYMAARAA